MISDPIQEYFISPRSAFLVALSVAGSSIIGGALARRALKCGWSQVAASAFFATTVAERALVSYDLRQLENQGRASKDLLVPITGFPLPARSHRQGWAIRLLGIGSILGLGYRFSSHRMNLALLGLGILLGTERIAWGIYRGNRQLQWRMADAITIYEHRLEKLHPTLKSVAKPMIDHLNDGRVLLHHPRVEQLEHWFQELPSRLTTFEIAAQGALDTRRQDLYRNFSDYGSRALRAQSSLNLSALQSQLYTFGFTKLDQAELKLRQYEQQLDQLEQKQAKEQAFREKFQAHCEEVKTLQEPLKKAGEAFRSGAKVLGADHSEVVALREFIDSVPLHRLPPADWSVGVTQSQLAERTQKVILLVQTEELSSLMQSARRVIADGQNILGENHHCLKLLKEWHGVGLQAADILVESSGMQQLRQKLKETIEQVEIAVEISKLFADGSESMKLRDWLEELFTQQEKVSEVLAQELAGYPKTALNCAATWSAFKALDEAREQMATRTLKEPIRTIRYQLELVKKAVAGDSRELREKITVYFQLEDHLEGASMKSLHMQLLLAQQHVAMSAVFVRLMPSAKYRIEALQQVIAKVERQMKIVESTYAKASLEELKEFIRQMDACVIELTSIPSDPEAIEKELRIKIANLYVQLHREAGVSKSLEEGASWAQKPKDELQEEARRFNRLMLQVHTDRNPGQNEQAQKVNMLRDQLRDKLDQLPNPISTYQTTTSSTTPLDNID